jgi:hypothetical protein
MVADNALDTTATYNPNTGTMECGLEANCQPGSSTCGVAACIGKTTIGIPIPEPFPLFEIAAIVVPY